MSETNKENIEQDSAENAPESQEQAAAENVEQVNIEEKAAEEEKTQTSEEPVKPAPEELLAELNDKYLRLRADFDNYRKRMAREANETRERSKIMVVSDFLPVYDFFQMAMVHAEQTQDFNALKQGMQMIMSEFTRAFDGLGIQEIKAEGSPFDPALHEAAKTESSDTVPEGTVIKQWKSGYKIGDRLIRPSMVVVSSGPAKEEAIQEEGTDKEQTEKK